MKKQIKILMMFLVLAIGVIGYDTTVQAEEQETTYEIPRFIDTRVEGIHNGQEENLWYRAGELKLMAEVEDTENSVVEVFASLKSEILEIHEEDKVPMELRDGVYECLITDTDFGLRTYYFYLIDVYGNVAKAEQMESFRRDSHGPKPEEIKVAFFASDQKDSISLPDGVVTKFIDYVKNLFVTKQIKAVFYVADEKIEETASGISQMVIEFDRKTYTLTGKTDPVLGETVFEIVLPQETEENPVNLQSRIAIKSIEDAAGNRCSGAGDEPLFRSNAWIVVDEVSPVLRKVEYSEARNLWVNEGECYHFYQMEDQPMISIELEETHFAMEGSEGEKSSPVLKFFPEDFSVEESVWNFEGERAFTTIGIPGETSSETEYRFSLGYQDPSGNVMIGEESYPCDENGIFYSDRIVVDDAAPELTSFEIRSNGGQLTAEGDTFYAENLPDQADLQILVSIKDSQKFFQEDEAAVEYSKDGIEWKKLKLCEQDEWSFEDEQYSAVFYFDGEEGETQTYQFRVSYQDRAEHKMIMWEGLSKETKETENGTFQSVKKIVIDHQNPELMELFFDKPVQIYEEETIDSNGKAVESIGNAETRLYYDKNMKAMFSVFDRSLKAEDMRIQLFERSDKAKTWEEVPIKALISQTEENGKVSCELSFPKENMEYYFHIFYSDRSGNSLVYAEKVQDTAIGEAYENGISKETSQYQSPVFIWDNKEPYYEIVSEHGTEDYNCLEESKIILNCFDTNLDVEQSCVEIEGKDVLGNVLFCSKTPLQEYKNFLNNQTVLLNLTEEANYHIRVQLIDKVQKTKSYEKKFCVDRTEPYITIVTKDGKSYTNCVEEQSGLLDLEKSDLTYSVSDHSDFSTVIDKLKFGYFSKASIISHIKVHDDISGVAGLYFSSIDSQGEEIKNYLSKMETIEENPGMIQYDIELPENFKGVVKAHGIDRAGNIGKDTGAIGFISETEEKHREVSGEKLEILSKYSKTPNYYAGDVDVKFEVWDEHSGLYAVDYVAGNYQKTDVYPSKEELCLKETREYKLSSKENNTNNVVLGVNFLDHAGYESELSKEKIPVVHIDTTVPEIEVVYDLESAENEYYFKEKRSALITIRERNFDPEDTDLEVTGPPVTISSWKHIQGSGCLGGSNPKDTHHTDQCQWTSKVEFSNDGNYTFTCKTTDLAGNEAAYGKTDKFIIDTTMPEVRVTYDNQEFKNSFYYNDRRIATIEITEKNFRDSDVVITMTAQDQGAELPLPKVEGWSSVGDINRARIVYDYDGEFTFDISCKDLAGNEAADYEEDFFIIDQTMPEIMIENVEHLSANNGKVAPYILWTDKNFDPDGMEVTLNGFRSGMTKTAGKKKVIANGMEYQMEDFAYEREKDDVYTLYATVQDLAGNSSEATVLFSVNRFGSVYQFSKDTEKLVGERGSYYTQEGQELTVIETNVDTLEFQEITLNHNGKLKTLEFEKDYQMFVSGSTESWKQYTYRIYKENFLEEGVYVLTIYSEDRADNLSDNHSKGKKIEFVVDRTAPSILMTGIENKGQYREERKEVLLDIEDNVSMDRIEVLLNGKLQVYYSEDLAKNNGKIEMVISSLDKWQDLRVTAYDKAGNESNTDKIEFLLTPNLWVQFYENQLLFWGSLFSIFLIFLFVYMIVQRRKENFGKAS